MVDLDKKAGFSKGDRTRERVLAQAARLFALHGYEGVSMDRLAGALKLSKGAVYAHFRGKYDIFVEAVVAWLDKCNRTRPSIDPDASPEQNLRHYLDWLLTTFERDKTYRLLMLRLFIEADEKTTRLVAARSMEPPVSQLTDLIYAYRPQTDALAFVYSFSAIAMLNPDLRKSMAIFDREAGMHVRNGSLLEHLMGIIRAM